MATKFTVLSLKSEIFEKIMRALTINYEFSLPGLKYAYNSSLNDIMLHNTTKCKPAHITLLPCTLLTYMLCILCVIDCENTKEVATSIKW